MQVSRTVISGAGPLRCRPWTWMQRLRIFERRRRLRHRRSRCTGWGVHWKAKVRISKLEELMRRHCNWLRRWQKRGRAWQPWVRKTSEERPALAEIFNFRQRRGLDVVEQSHEAEIHVELLMTV